MLMFSSPCVGLGRPGPRVAIAVTLPAMSALTGRKILVTGLTGSVGFPVARRLAEAGNEVWGLARYSAKGSRERVEAAGVRPVTADLVEADFSGVPDDFEYVLNFA